jgi:ribosome biogenesis GTPase
MAKPRKLRVEFRKNRSTRRRAGDLTRRLGGDLDAAADHAASERISGKGDLTRKRTVMTTDPADDRIDGLPVEPAAGEVWRGRVLNVHGLESLVQADDGRVVRCTLRRLLRTVATDQRHPLAAGDWVRVRGLGDEGTIQSIEPRTTSLSRDSRGRRHVIVANVDQACWWRPRPPGSGRWSASTRSISWIPPRSCRSRACMPGWAIP